jgi:putative lipoprotein
VKTYLLILLVISLAISACTAQPTAEPSASLIGAWTLTSFGTVDSQTPALSDVEAGVTFSEDGTLTGDSGCNGFGGNYTVQGNQITFSEIVSTLMLCDEPIMEQEEAVYQVLTDTASFQIEGNRLTLTNNDRMLVFTTIASYPSYP